MSIQFRDYICDLFFLKEKETKNVFINPYMVCSYASSPKIGNFIKNGWHLKG